MSMSTEHIIDRIDEATRFNTSNKQVCNDALSLARGRLASLQNSVEAKDKRIEELESKIEAKDEHVAELVGEIKFKNNIIEEWSKYADQLHVDVRDLTNKLAGLYENSSGQGTDGCEIVQDASGNLTIKCSSGSGEDRWIPCSEKLPTFMERILIKVKNTNKHFINTDYAPRVGHLTPSGTWMIFGDLGVINELSDNFEVIRWKPLMDYVEPEVKPEPVEDAKFEIGDFVICVSKHGVKMNAIYLKEGEECYQVLEKESQRIQPLDKKYWKLTKYPGHISVVDWLNGLPES